MAVCSEIHTKHINTLCGQKVELLNVKPCGKYSDQWAVDSAEETPHSLRFIPPTTPKAQFHRSHLKFISTDHT